MLQLVLLTREPIFMVASDVIIYLLNVYNLFKENSILETMIFEILDFEIIHQIKLMFTRF